MPAQIKSAYMSDFQTPTTRILFGERLKDVQQIQLSISKHGLLNPITVMPREKKLVVIDGKKRIAALRRMRFAGTLPRSLVRIPYIIVDQDTAQILPHLSLLTNREKFEEVLNLHQKGFGLMEIATTLYISKQCVKDLLNISRLSLRLQRAYFGGDLSINQARAFATLPNREAQDSLLIALGPFANAPDILRAITSGDTVIDIGDENVIILPSRSIPNPIPLAA